MGHHKDYSPPGPIGSLKWLAVDLDQTLAESYWSPDNPTTEIGPPIWGNIEKLRRAADKGYKIVIHTARGSEFVLQIEYFLNFYNIPFSRIVTGKVLALKYIDDKAVNADEEEWV